MVQAAATRRREEDLQSAEQAADKVVRPNIASRRGVDVGGSAAGRRGPDDQRVLREQHGRDALLQEHVDDPRCK